MMVKPHVIRWFPRNTVDGGHPAKQFDMDNLPLFTRF